MLAGKRPFGLAMSNDKQSKRRGLCSDRHGPSQFVGSTRWFYPI
jgi:hypothetical protein